ncbi:MAG: hypothetical protein LBF76_01045 [Holosporales bacterium]|jgi:hypothetical protein|nr:hypothetical protein [Holosporales bacterium]
MPVLKSPLRLPGILLSLLPLTFLPLFPNPLFPLWLLGMQDFLQKPPPSFLGLWLVCLAYDFLHNFTVGLTFFSFACLYCSVDLGCKRLSTASFPLLWLLATATAIGGDMLFFRGEAWHAFRDGSWKDICKLITLYPLIILIGYRTEK